MAPPCDVKDDLVALLSRRSYRDPLRRYFVICNIDLFFLLLSLTVFDHLLILSPCVIGNYCCVVLKLLLLGGLV
jgi:hypothetical protein